MMNTQPQSSPRHVLMLAYDDANLLDIAGPYQMFAATLRADGTPAYRVELVAENPEVTASVGLTLLCQRTFAEIDDETLSTLDTLIVVGGEGSRQTMFDETLLSFIRTVHKKARRTASVCTGAFLLAAAGIADGKRLATHWGSASRLQEKFPHTRVDGEALFVQDGCLWSSAGVTAGIDLSLAMIEEDLGRRTALELARHHVLYLMRSGNQTQFSTELAAQCPTSNRLRDVCTAILEAPNENWTVSLLATRASMSERSFVRHFTRETGFTPATFVERARVDHARRLIEAGQVGLHPIAHLSGFRSPDRMRRAFLRRLGITPSTYRAHFSPSTHNTMAESEIFHASSNHAS